MTDTTFPAAHEITRWRVVQTPTKRHQSGAVETPVIENVPYLLAKLCCTFLQESNEAYEYSVERM